MKKPVFEPKIELEKCKGCGLCLAYCPLGCFLFTKELNLKGVKAAKFSQGKKCTGCGNCFLICPDNCIEIYEKK